MPPNKFSQRKLNVLSKNDKSCIGKWDFKIKDLCEKINEHENYYTTSSCSGRIVLLVDNEKKASDLFLKVYHELVEFAQFKRDLNEIIQGQKINIFFKQEPAIIHIACENLNEAKKIMEFAKLSGWKRSGLISFENRIILELLNTERIEFPIVKDGKILISDEFLKISLEKANKNLEKSWEKIERLRKLVEKL